MEPLSDALSRKPGYIAKHVAWTGIDPDLWSALWPRVIHDFWGATGTNSSHRRLWRDMWEELVYESLKE